MEIIMPKTESLFIKLQKTYHSAFCILWIGPKEVITILTITWKVIIKAEKFYLVKGKEKFMRDKHTYVMFLVGAKRQIKHSR